MKAKSFLVVAAILTTAGTFAASAAADAASFGSYRGHGLDSQKLAAEQMAKYDQLVEAVIAHNRERVDAITSTFTFLDWMGLKVGITRVPKEKKQQMLWAVQTYPQTLHDDARPTFLHYLKGVEPVPPPSVVNKAPTPAPSA
jgi:hypothetical protein